MCKKWLDENWDSHAKAVKQRGRKKAAAATKKFHERPLDDSVEIHALEDNFGPSAAKKESKKSSRSSADVRQVSPPRDSHRSLAVRPVKPSRARGSDGHRSRDDCKQDHDW